MKAKITFDLDLIPKATDEEIIDILKSILSDKVDMLAMFRESGLVGFSYEIDKD
jgi:hypothetical protein